VDVAISSGTCDYYLKWRVNNMAQISIIRTLDEFEALKDKWDCLFAANPRLRVFQTYEWNRIVWEKYHNVELPDETLYIVHAVHDGKLKQETILPFCRSKNGVLHFIGYMMADVLDAISPAHVDNWHCFYAEIIEFLKEQKDVADISLWKMEGISEVLLYFGAHWPYAKINHQETCSYFIAEKDASIESAFPHLDSKGRSNLRRISKKFPELDFKVYSKDRGCEFPREQLLDIRNHMIENGLRVYASCPDSYIESMEGLYHLGLCEVSSLNNENGQFQYSAFRLIARDHVNFWVVFYRNGALTTVGDVKYFLEKTHEGCYCYDYGTGAYSYKLLTFRPLIVQLYSVEGHPLSLSNLVRDVINLLRRYVKAWLVQLRLRKK